MRGGLNAIPFSRFSNSPRIGSIIAEWNACEVNSRRLATDCFASFSSNAAISGVGPETTLISGLLTAASESAPLNLISLAASGTASIEPAGRS